jgi:hypothetical protein
MSPLGTQGSSRVRAARRASLASAPGVHAAGEPNLRLCDFFTWSVVWWSVEPESRIDTVSAGPAPELAGDGASAQCRPARNAVGL